MWGIYIVYFNCFMFWIQRAGRTNPRSQTDMKENPRKSPREPPNSAIKEVSQQSLKISKISQNTPKPKKRQKMFLKDLRAKNQTIVLVCHFDMIFSDFGRVEQNLLLLFCVFWDRPYPKHSLISILVLRKLIGWVFCDFVLLVLTWFFAARNPWYFGKLGTH